MVFNKRFIPLLIIVILIVDVLIAPVLVVITDSNKYVSGDQILSSTLYTYDDLFSSHHEEFDAKNIITWYSNGLVDNTQASNILEYANFQKVSVIKYSLIMLLYTGKNQAGSISLTEPLRLYQGDLSEKINLLANESGYVTSGKLLYFNNNLYLVAHIKNKDEQDYKNESTDNMILSVSDYINNRICLFKVDGADTKTLNNLNKDSGENKKNYPDIFFDLRYDMTYRIIAVVLFLLQFVIVIGTYILISKKKNMKSCCKK